MNKRRIYINGRFLNKRITGVQRYALNMMTALDALLSEYPSYEAVLLTPRGVTDKKTFERIIVKEIGVLSGHLWEQIELPKEANDGILINLCNTAPAFKREQIVVIHDAAVFRFPQGYSHLFVHWYKLLFKLIVRFSKRIITVSEFSKSELLHFLKFEREKISVIPPAVNFNVEHNGNYLQTDEPQVQSKYFLAVSSLDPRKNFEGIIRAFSQLNIPDLQLFIVGAANSKVFKNPNIKPIPNVRLTGYVSDLELTKLYKNAIGFIYPSFYEGFGIPPLEAMFLECPVIVSSVASLPEVCGDAAIYCEPDKVSSIKLAMEKLYYSPDLREELKKRGKIKALNFSYQLSAKKLLNLLHE